MNQSDNELISGLTHSVGVLLSIAGLTLLVVFSSLYGSVEKTVGFSIFGAGLILLYLASATYHFISKKHRAKTIFKNIDYSMIYILIASTYTSLTLALPQAGLGWTLFGIVWGLALAGILLKVFLKLERDWLSPTLFIIMGWLSVITIPTLLRSIPLSGIGWLVLGGLFYTIGVAFFALAKRFPKTGWFGMHEIFHLFVMGGSFSHFWFMFRYVLYM
ncbi:MAG: hemolysin III family protein [Patescibacteria group bacterium]|nr:hemolysin III family protein [Patescibacteria group bacterium]